MARCKVARFYGPNDLRVEEAVQKRIGPADVAIRPVAVGLCGTDAHIFEGRFPAVAGTVLGHEIAGEIVEVGGHVEGLARGDLISVEPHLYCHRCCFCRIGAEHLCLNKQAFGIHLDGGLSTHLVVPAGCAYKVPDAIGPDAAALCEPLGCCIHGMDRLAPQLGDSLLIIGAGPAGLLLTKLAALRGVSPLVVMDLRSERRESAKSMGADHVVDPSSPVAPQMLADVTAGLGFSTVIEAAGTAATFEFAVAQAAPGGRILVFGAAPKDDCASVKPFEIFAKELTVIGTVRNPYTHQRALSLLRHMPVHHLRIQKYDLDDIHSAIEAQQKGAGAKIIVCP